MKSMSRGLIYEALQRDRFAAAAAKEGRTAERPATSDSGIAVDEGGRAPCPAAGVANIAHHQFRETAVENVSRPSPETCPSRRRRCRVYQCWCGDPFQRCISPSSFSSVFCE